MQPPGKTEDCASEGRVWSFQQETTKLVDDWSLSLSSSSMIISSSSSSMIISLYGYSVWGLHRTIFPAWPPTSNLLLWKTFRLESPQVQVNLPYLAADPQLGFDLIPGGGAVKTGSIQEV